MSYTFDGPNKLVILPPGTVSLGVGDMYSRWKEWVALGDNLKYRQALRVVGGDPTVGANTISSYFFLMNGWRVRPQEANHILTVKGTLLDEDGSDPFAATIGLWRVRIVQVVPLLAETIMVSTGGTAGLTTEQAAMLSALAKIHGLIPGTPLVVSSTTRVAGDISQTIVEQGGLVTVSRV